MPPSLLLLVVLVAGACPSKQAAGPGSGSQGSNVAQVTGATTCADVRGRVEQLYRAEAMAKEPGRVDEAVADNTAMVMSDCARDPATFVPCLAASPSVAELERTCIVPVDDEGTEGER
jgi:hypothetical protein